MRIISGQSRGSRLQAPPGRAVRPSSDKLRGAVMSALGGFFDGERVLDLCAGTGAMALEFLSRGCGRAIAVERDPTALGVLRANAAHTKLADRLEVIAGDVLPALEALGRRGERFDFVFLDPPYDADLYAPVLARLAAGDLLAGGAEVLVESRCGLDDAVLAGTWQLIARRRYGSSVLDRLERVAAET